jgi:hypothetical protein
MRGVAVVEATCSRAANATWNDNTPSPDLAIASPPPFASAARALCVAPGLVSTPIKSLINGRMTLTQTITFSED